MRFNIFAGTRRVVLVIGVISILGFVYWAIENSPPTVYTTFTVDSPGAKPTWANWGFPHDLDIKGMDVRKDIRTKTGKDVTLYLLFPERKADDGRMFIPLRSEGGRWWGNEAYSEPVETYTKQVADSFTFSAAQEGAMDKQSSHLRWKNIREAAGFLVGWLVFLGIGTWVVGWIVRGFFGIPSGLDFKPENVKPEPVVEEA